MPALLARSVARTFATAEWHMIVDAGRRKIDHHHAGSRSLSEVAGMFERAGTDARREAEDRVVGDRQRLIIGIDLDHRGDRSDDLLVVDAHLVGGVIYQGWAQIMALGVVV